MNSSPRNLYKDLELTPAASPEQIKSAYRRLGYRHHPDRNPGDTQAPERFRRIAEAYHVLGDPKLRAEYDLARKAGPKAMRSFWSKLPDAFASIVPSFGDFREACKRRDWHAAASSGVDTITTVTQFFQTLNTIRNAHKGS